MNISKLITRIFSLLLLFPLLAAGQGQQLLSFEDALQIMSKDNPAILRKREEIKQKEFDAKSKKGLYYPIVSLNAQAVAMADPLHLDLSAVRDAITPIYSALGNYGVFSGVTAADGTTYPDAVSTAAIRQKLLAAGEEIENAEWDQTIQEKNFATVSASFTYPIYAGGKVRSANKAANVEIQITNEELRHTKAVLLTELVTRYYGLVLGNEAVKLRTQMAESMQEHYNDAKKLFDNGMIAKVELLHAEVAKNEAERELDQAKRNIEIIRSGLKATLANDSLNAVMPTSRLFINKDLQNIQSWVALAKKSNPQLMQIQGKKELANIKHRVEKNAYMPTIAAMGNYNIVDKDLSPYMPDWMVGVGLNWTLFNGMARKNNIKSSQTLNEQVAYAEQKANDDIEAYITKLYQTLQMQIEQKEELETTLELATEYCRSTEKAFNEGLATSTSVVDANTKVIAVKTKRLKVMFDYDVALAYFFQTTGTPEKFVEYCNGENTIYESLD